MVQTGYTEYLLLCSPSFQNQSDKNKNNANYPAQHNAGYFKFRTEFRIIFQYSCSVYIKKDQKQKRNK